MGEVHHTQPNQPPQTLRALPKHHNSSKWFEMILHTENQLSIGCLKVPLFGEVVIVVV